MKCSEARQIINLLLDGDLPDEALAKSGQHPQAEEARTHVKLCTACMEWQSSMDRAVSLISAEQLPEIDLSAAIMSRLPEHHPASQRQRRRIPGRALVWLAACWAAGLLAVLMIGIGVSHWLSPDRTAGLVMGTYDFIRASVAILGHIFATCMVVFDAISRVFAHQGVTAPGLGSFASWFLVLDSAFLVAIAAIWFRRKKAHGLFVVVG